MPYEWSPPHPAWIYLGLALVLAALVIGACRVAKCSSARRWPLLALRVGVLALLVCVLLNLVKATEVRLPGQKQKLICLVDCSRSMGLDRPVSRLDQVKRVLERFQSLVRAQGAVGGAETASSSEPVRLSVFRFGDQLIGCKGLEDLAPTDDATRLLDALENLPRRFESKQLPLGVVVFSDGRTTEMTGFDEVAAGYHRLGVPVHVFPVGDPVGGDVAIQEIIAPREAPPGARLPVRVVVRTRGYAGQRTEVRIRPLTDLTSKPLASLPITLVDGVREYDLVIDQSPVTRDLVAEVPPFPDEAILENNRISFQVVSRKSKVRVIYMEGTLNNEYHWLRDALVEDPNIECLAMEVNNQYDIKPTLHRVGDPARGYPTTREEMFNYDVVICSDIKRASFTQEQVDWTLELVANRGGGFAMIGGNTSFGAGYWDQTLWDGLIPVSMGGQANSPGRGTCWGLQFFVKVPQAAERHPIWRMVDDPIKNRQILDRMPMFTGSNLVEGLKPAAVPLGFSDRPLPRVGVMPVFACETFGKGRTFAMTTDTTDDWGHYFERNWGEAGDNRYYRKFWRNVIYWLSENSAGSKKRLRVETDKIVYRPGQPIQIKARAFDERLEQTIAYRLIARLRPPGGKGVKGERETSEVLQEIPLPVDANTRQYQGELATPPLAKVPVSSNQPLAAVRLVTLEVYAYENDKVIERATLDVQIVDDPIEFENPQPDVERLEQIARASGGKRLHTAEEVVQLIYGRPDSSSEVLVQKAPQWDHPLIWLALVALLAAEWSLRRWWGLA